VTRLKRAGAPTALITLVTGHKTVAMQDRYTVFNQEDLALYLGKVSEALREAAMKVA